MLELLLLLLDREEIELELGLLLLLERLLELDPLPTLLLEPLDRLLLLELLLELLLDRLLLELFDGVPLLDELIARILLWPEPRSTPRGSSSSLPPNPPGAITKYGCAVQLGIRKQDVSLSGRPCSRAAGSNRTI